MRPPSAHRAGGLLAALLAALAFSILVPAAGCAKDRAAPVILAAESTATWLDGPETGSAFEESFAKGEFEPPGEEWHFARRDLPAVAARLDAHLREHPQDARALLVRGRILRLQYMNSVFGEKAGAPVVGANEDPRDSVVALFDRALALDPALPDAHFWKAMTLVTTSIGDGSGSFASVGKRFDRALPEARLAYDEAPRDARRINLLEQCLLGTGQDVEAERVRDPAVARRGRPTPVERILARQEGVPAPPGAGLLPQMREVLGGVGGRHTRDQTAAARYARVRVYGTATVSTDSLLTFYRRIWPALQWEDVTTPVGQLFVLNPVTRSAAATLLWREGAGWVTPAMPLQNVLARKDVLLVSITEYDMGAALSKDEVAAFRNSLPDSLRDVPLPSWRTVMYVDNVEVEP